MAGRDEDEGMAPQGTRSGSGGGFFGYDSFADMRDGGGAGRSGSRFEGGGILSDIANMVATPRSARGADTGQIRPVARPSMDMINAARDRVNAPYSFGRDLLDGGGLGRRATLEEINAGQGFYGGVPSMIANMVGIRPMGANDLGLVASYDAALASRPDISNQMDLLSSVTKAQGAGGLQNLGYPVNASGMISDGRGSPSGVETENFDVGFKEYVGGLGSAAEGATQDELRQGYIEQMRLLGDAGAAVKPYGTMVTNADVERETLRNYNSLPRPELNYEMPADLLAQVTSSATRGISRGATGPEEIEMRVPVYESMTDPSKDMYENDERDLIAKEIYNSDRSFLSLEDARELVADPVAYQSYVNSRR